MLNVLHQFARGRHTETVRTPASDVVTTKSETVPGSDVIKSISTDTVTITPKLQQPLEPGDTAILHTPTDSRSYRVELATGVKVSGAENQSITISRPGQNGREVPHTYIGLDQYGGFYLHSRQKEMAEYVKPDGTILLDVGPGDGHPSKIDVEYSYELKILPDGRITSLGWSKLTNDPCEVPASEEPDGALKLKTSSDDYLVVQPFLTRKDVNG